MVGVVSRVSLRLTRGATQRRVLTDRLYRWSDRFLLPEATQRPISVSKATCKADGDLVTGSP